MSTFEMDYSNDTISKKYTKKQSKFLEKCIFSTYTVINDSKLGETAIYVINGKAFQLDKTFNNKLVELGFKSGVYQHTVKSFQKPELAISTDILIELCGYYKQDNFETCTNIPGFQDFYTIMICILSGAKITGTPKEIYKCGVMADYLICDYIKKECFNILAGMKQLTSVYYALKLIKKLDNWDKEIDFILNHTEKTFNGKPREIRKLRKIVKYFTGQETSLSEDLRYYESSSIYLSGNNKYYRAYYYNSDMNRFFR